jgi:hypothetical protein
MRNALANLIELPAIRQTPIVTLYAGLRRIDEDVLGSSVSRVSRSTREVRPK